MSKINLLPWREELKTQQTKNFWGALVVCVLLTGGSLYGVQSYYQNLQTKQAQRNQFLQQQIAILDHQIGEIRKVEEQKKSLQERINLIQQLQQSRNLPTKIFNGMPELAPTGVYLDELKFANSHINVDGKAEANYRVARFMRNVEGTSWLTTPQISSIVALNQGDAELDLSRFKLGFNVVEGLPTTEAAK